MKSKCVVLLVSLLMASAVVGQDYQYRTNHPDTNTIAITKYTGTGGAVTIPEIINGKTVTWIEDGAFRQCTSIISVTISDNITSIGNYAFYECSSLTNVIIPQSITSIGNDVFFICHNLPDVAIPASVTNIGKKALYGCGNLTAITVEPSNSIYSSLDGVLFNKSRTTLIQCPGGKGGSFTIPACVTNIEDGAFGRCSGLTSVTIPDTVTSIVEGAFRGCTSLTNITLPNNITSIGDGAFYGCTSLTNITIPASVTNIEGFAFCYCTNLTAIYFKGNAPSFGEYVFCCNGDEKSTVYYLPGTKGWGATFGQPARPTKVWKP